MSPIRRIAAGLAVAVVAILATAAPASAHDQLISSTPAQNEQLGSPPESVSLTFSGQLLVLDSSMSGAVVLVVDESGKDWVSGEVEVIGDTVTAPLQAGMPVAGYQVRWQVVSEDGHPISGVIPFTVGDAEPMATASTGSGVSNDEPSAAEDQTAGAVGDDTGRTLLIGVSGAAVAVIALALYRILRRPRTTPAPPKPGENAAENL